MLCVCPTFRSTEHTLEAHSILIISISIYLPPLGRWSCWYRLFLHITTNKNLSSISNTSSVGPLNPLQNLLASNGSYISIWCFLAYWHWWSVDRNPTVKLMGLLPPEIQTSLRYTTTTVNNRFHTQEPLTPILCHFKITSMCPGTSQETPTIIPTKAAIVAVSLIPLPTVTS